MRGIPWSWNWISHRVSMWVKRVALAQGRICRCQDVDRMLSPAMAARSKFWARTKLHAGTMGNAESLAAVVKGKSKYQTCVTNRETSWQNLGHRESVFYLKESNFKRAVALVEFVVVGGFFFSCFRGRLYSDPTSQYQCSEMIQTAQSGSLKEEGGLRCWK